MVKLTPSQELNDLIEGLDEELALLRQSIEILIETLKASGEGEC